MKTKKRTGFLEPQCTAVAVTAELTGYPMPITQFYGMSGAGQRKLHHGFPVELAIGTL